MFPPIEPLFDPPELPQAQDQGQPIAVEPSVFRLAFAKSEVPLGTRSASEDHRSSDTAQRKPLPISVTSEPSGRSSRLPSHGQKPEGSRQLKARQRKTSSDELEISWQLQPKKDQDFPAADRCRETESRILETVGWLGGSQF